MKLEKIQFITHSNSRYNYLESAIMALESGVKFVQLRIKDASLDEIVFLGKLIRKECDKYNATFLIDDYVELVNEIEANGVHLGKEDMPIKEARKILGKDRIIGATANTYKDIVKHYNDGADYIGLGPLRFTNTKQGLSPIIGIEGYKDIINKCRANNIDIPIYAIGGIKLEDIEGLQSTGVYGLAISSLILESEDPSKTIKEINLIIQ
ncbi:MAG: thiamine phosphate synthase [Bacteroidales bacterium]